MQELISVIIPCYNSSTTIKRALDSVLRQTHGNVEIIVVDDASADGDALKKEIGAFQDSRIKIVQHGTNKNGAAARNTGILIASGNYIAFLDADDEWLPKHLECSLKRYQTMDPSKYIIYCRNHVITSPGQDIIMPSDGIGSNEHVSDYLFSRAGYMSTPSLVGSASIFRENLFEESLIRHQDYELLLRLESKGIGFLFSDHTGVIVHWEQNDTAKKGGTADFSFNFARKYKSFFTPKAYTNFIVKNVVYPLFIQKERRKGLKIFISDGKVSKLSIKNWIFFLDYFIWGKLKMVKLIAGK